MNAKIPSPIRKRSIEPSSKTMALATAVFAGGALFGPWVDSGIGFASYWGLAAKDFFTGTSAGSAVWAALCERSVDKKTRERFNSLEPLQGAQDLLRDVILSLNGLQDPNFRMCIHAPVAKNTEKVEQITDYSGPIRNGAGRQISSRIGIVGVAIRDGKLNQPYFHHVKDKISAEDRITEFTSKFGYTPEEAKQVNHKTKAWIAHPFGANGQLLGVLYADSEVSDFFGSISSVRRKALTESTISLASLAARRYEIQ